MSASAAITRRLTVPDLSGYPAVMSKHDLAKVFGRSVRWVELHVAAGSFPIPRLARLSTLGWNHADVQRFFEDRTFDPLPGPVGKSSAAPAVKSARATSVASPVVQHATEALS